MSEEKLDQLVKDSPPPEARKIHVSPNHTSPILTPPANPSDPLSSLPSSPPQIYLNLLLLEASLRAQYLELRSRRRSHTFFLTLLLAWDLFFLWALFLRPREDGSGVGGSIYWVVEMTEKMCLMGGVVTGVLVWGTGQWERGIRWPRRWLWTTNRGLRGFNLKIVIVKGPWWKELWETISFLFSYGLFSSSRSSSYRFISSHMLQDEKIGEHVRHAHTIHHKTSAGLPHIHEEGHAAAGIEEDLSPGGDYIRLLLLPKPFSPGFRENWELYRTEYWERENERRLQLRLRVADHDRQSTQQAGGWLRRTAAWRGFARRDKGPDGGRGAGPGSSSSSSSHGAGDVERPAAPRDAGLLSVVVGAGKRTRSGSVMSASHSRTSSRSSTPEIKAEEGGAPHAAAAAAVAGSRAPRRRGSSGGTASSRRKRTASTSRGLAPRGALRGEQRSVTPEPLQGRSLGRSGGAGEEGERARPRTPLSEGEASVRSWASSSGGRRGGK